MQPDVLVVGAGPVGLTMAAELARYGVPVRIVDQGAQRSDKSKALVLWSRSLELIDRMGCGAAFVSTGLKVRAANIKAGGREVARIGLDTTATPHPYALMLPQSETERLLEEHLNACGVQVERQVALLQVAPEADKVTATLRHAATGQEERVEAKWLIGCDGAHSTVRHQLGMRFEGDTLPSDWMLADVHLAGDLSDPDELNLFWHADGVLALFPIARGRYRIIADLGEARADKHPADPTLADVQALLDHRGPGGMVASEPVWLSSFRINERMVAAYRAGRVFLAGDAAHVHSPAGGQGMNTGIQDACNLAWKLSLVCWGFTGEEPLLDSYSVERHAVGRLVLANAGRLTTLAVLRGGMAQAVRNHVASLVFGLSPVRNVVANTLAELSIGYQESPLTLRASRRHHGPAPGERAPISDNLHPVGAGDSPRFALFAEADETGSATVARHRDLLEPEMRPPFASDGIWLVRPDGYVALVADRGAWAEVAAYLDRVATRAP